MQINTETGEIRTKQKVTVRNPEGGAGVTVEIDRNTVLVDGRINVEKTATSYKVHDKNMPAHYTDRGIQYDRYEMDKHPYQNYNSRGYTVEQSVEKAYEKVYFDLLPYDVTPTLASSVKEGITYLIRNNEGRDACYRIAGGVAKGFREGYYKGVPAGQVFKLIATGEMQPVEMPGKPFKYATSFDRLNFERY